MKKKTNEAKKMPSKATVVRTLVLALTLVNSALALADKSPLPFSDSQITELVSYVFTAAAAIVGWWKNNSFTQKAIAADEIMKEGE